MCFWVCGGTGDSKRMFGPRGVEPENNDDRSGKIKSSIRGRRDVNIEPAVCGGSSPVAGRLRGLGPPNWFTRIPGPPPRLKTKPGPVSNPFPCVSLVHRYFVDMYERTTKTSSSKATTKELPEQLFR